MSNPLLLNSLVPIARTMAETLANNKIAFINKERIKLRENEIQRRLNLKQSCLEKLFRVKPFTKEQIENEVDNFGTFEYFDKYGVFPNWYSRGESAKTLAQEVLKACEVCAEGEEIYLSLNDFSYLRESIIK